jgi:hypothetical protein
MHGCVGLMRVVVGVGVMCVDFGSCGFEERLEGDCGESVEAT